MQLKFPENAEYFYAQAGRQGFNPQDERYYVSLPQRDSQQFSGNKFSQSKFLLEQKIIRGKFYVLSLQAV